MYELFDHTADLGLRVVAPDLDGLFRDAGQGLFAIIADGWEAERATRMLEFRIEADRREWLLFDWLNELLYTFDSEKLLLGGFEVSVGERRVEARAAGEPLDASKHRLLHEVKAITYHGLRVEQGVQGWLAEVIVDI